MTGHLEQALIIRDLRQERGGLNGAALAALRSDALAGPRNRSMR